MTSPAPSRRILIVSSHFPPDSSAGTQRVLRIANDFQQQGWATVVLTIDPTAYRHNIPLDSDSLSRAEPDITVEATGAVRGITAAVRFRRAVLSRPKPTPYSLAHGGTKSGGRRAFGRARQFATNLFTFPDEEIGWLCPAVVRGLKLIRKQRFDLIFSSAPPFTSHLVARALTRVSDIPWVADFRDPWARPPWGTRGSATGHRWLEAMTVHGADAVILNTPELLEDFSVAYGSLTARKFHAVANGYDATVIKAASTLHPPQRPPLVITHAGSLYHARNPLPFFEALAKCQQDGRIPRGSLIAQFLGKIAGEFDAPGAIQRLGLVDTVVLRPPIPRQACLEALAASHVLLVIQPGTLLQVPAKLYEYVGLRRPILALASEGAVARVVQDAQCGVVVPAADVEAIAGGLHSLYAHWAKRAAALATNPLAARFDARHQNQMLRQVIESLTERRGAPFRAVAARQ